MELYETAIGLFDRSSEPVIICDPDHRIIYKNNSAVKLIPHPRKGSSLLSCISAGERSKLLSGDRQTVIVLNTPDPRYSKALKIRIGQGSMVIFPRFLQFMESSPGFEIEKSRILEDYVSVCRRLYENPAADKPKSPVSRLSEISGRMGSVLDSGRSMPIKQSVAAAISDIAAVGGKIMRRAKCIFNLETDGNGSLDGTFVTGIHFSYTVIRMMTFMSCFAVNRKIDLKISDRNSYIETEISCFSETIHSPGVTYPGFSFLIERFPSEKQTLAELECLIGYEGWEASFVYEPPSDNNEYGRLRGFLRLPDKSGDSNRLFIDDENYSLIKTERTRQALERIFSQISFPSE